MATYLQGVTDYISQVQPPQPNLEFDAKILQVKQSQYDAGHKKVSDLYSSLLNSDLTRTENIAARDEFFKMINTDIKKLSSMDFSLDENVAAASNIFKSVYDNKEIVKDMVWTKNFNKQVNISESFKNCIDPKKCGGQWWETGDKYLAYKKQEFKNSSSKDSMNMEDVSYVPYNSITDDAMKVMKDSKFNVVEDKISGGYKITTENGELAISPLSALLNSTIGKDPKFAEMYTAQAYVKRNEWVNTKFQTGEYKNLNEAHAAYHVENAKLVSSKVQDIADQNKVDLNQIDNLIATKEKQIKAGQLKQDATEYTNLLQLRENVAIANDKVELANQAIKNQNNQMGLKVIGDMYDQNAGIIDFQNDLNVTAKTLAKSNYKITKDADKFALEDKRFSNDEKLAKKKFEYDLQLIEHRAKYGDGSDGGGKLAKKESDFQQEQNDYLNLINYRTDGIKERFEQLLKDAGESKEGIDYNIIGSDINLKPDTDKTLLNLMQKAKEKYNADILSKRMEVNEKAHSANQMPPYISEINPDLFNAYTEDIQEQLIEKVAKENNIGKADLFKRIIDPSYKGYTLDEIAKAK